MFLYYGITAKENRGLETSNILGEFMQSYMNDMICVRLTGPVDKLLTKVFPNKYEIGIIYKKGIPVTYTRLKYALYGTLQADLLFWKNLTGTIKDLGFEINPYDECVANIIYIGQNTL